LALHQNTIMTLNATRHRSATWLAGAAALACLLMVGVVQWKSMRLIPGDLGDARLNNYFLENIFQYLSGTSRSLWHLGFFYPFPYVLGFSDNLFGSAPVYILARVFESDPHTAFQYWFLAGYLLNHTAAYVTLRKLGFDIVPSTVGALIFAFSLPTTAHAMHAQLHYRAAIPLAAFAFLRFLESPQPRHLASAVGWTVFQFYCGIYMGFFLLFFLGCLLAVKLATSLIDPGQSTREFFSQFATTCLDRASARYWIVIAVLGMALYTLLYPYLKVSRIYGFERSWDEISLMLPRVQSYFYSGASLIWKGTGSDWFASLPLPHEHQMFAGAVPLGLALLGTVVAWRTSDRRVLWLASAGLMMVLLTLKVGDHSIWYYLHSLPLASAIRAMTRLDQVLLLPMAVCAALALHSMAKWPVCGAPLRWVAVAALVAELSLVSMYANPKEEWTQRENNLAQTVNQAGLPANAALFFAQTSGPAFAAELDAMWVALRLGRPTLNGYSGNFPPGYSLEFGSDCGELHRRIAAHNDWARANPRDRSPKALRTSAVVPVGFPDCAP
jgi:hypothetical protein